ncbi:NAD-dependent protein deacylase [Feifania hominis]|uniref:NAD-dependent protein deacetylase n=1 Tax=Feifania hominis TaxID=2763660 RepID=A0A926HQ24_9FIRM|nr:NAD-dependent protein deacylase [Feifania hominis]MBC8535892.1 NAD-dependent protein deacylase [Feifania hominis]
MDKKLAALIENSQNIVFFGGAGVSTESGIPDFRGAGGLYRMRSEIPPETIVSHSFFLSHPEQFFRFYREHMVFPDARPNAAHRALAALERAGRLRAVITQNIDGLHQLAGSRAVYELHGSIHRNHCMRCGRSFGLDTILREAPVPLCPCGGTIKPDVVLYEEPLDSAVLNAAVKAIERADLLIVGGTSLSVYPAAGLLRYYRGGPLVLINRTPTPYDREADLLLTENIGEVFAGFTAE